VSGYLRDSQLRRQLEEKVKEAARTRQAAEEKIQAAQELIDAARRIDANVVEAEKALTDAVAAATAKDYKLAADRAMEAQERAKRIYRDRAAAILESSKGLVDMARGVGAEPSEAEAALEKAREALAADDLATAVDLAKKAWKRSEKLLSEHLSSSFSKVQSLILSAKNLGRDVAPVEDLLSRARTAMEGGNFQSALDFTKEGLETITDDLTTATRKEIRDAEDLVRTAQELGADVTKANTFLERARADVANLDFEKANNALRQSRAESEKALQRSLEGRIADFSRFVEEAKALGADTKAAQEHFAGAEAAIRQANYREAALRAKQGFQALQDAQFQRVVQTIAASRDKFVAAVNLGVDLKEPIAFLNNARQALQRGAFKEALDWAQKADEGVETIVGRFRRVQERLKELHRAFAEAEAFGVPTKSARRVAEAARIAYQDHDLDRVEREIAAAQEELQKAEREHVMVAIEKVEFILTLGEQNGADLSEASKFLQEAILAAKGSEFRKALQATTQALTRAEADLRKHLADRITVLREALPHLGDEGPTLKAILSRAEAAQASRDFEAAFRALDEGQRFVEERTRALARGIIEGLALAVQMGTDLGANVAKEESLYKELNATLGEGRVSEVLGARDRVQALLAATSENLLNLVKARIGQAQALRIDVQEMTDYWRRARMALGVQNFEEGLQLLKEANERASRATAMHRQAYDALSSAAAFVAEARKRNVDVTKVVELLVDAKKAFERLDYERTIALASEARAETEKLTVLYSAAQKILVSKERMDLAARLGIDAPHLRELASEAKEAMKAKDYEKALRLASRAEEEFAALIREKVTTILGNVQMLAGSVEGANLAPVGDEAIRVRQALEAGELAQAADLAVRLQDQLEKLKRQVEEADAAIRRVRELVADAEAMSLQVPETLGLLDKAERAYKTGHYEEALDYAAQAEAEALAERDRGIAAMMRRFEDSIERARKEGTDVRSAEKLYDRAKEFFRAKKYRQALATALQSEAEAERVALQQAMSSQAVQTIERKLKSLGRAAPPVERLAEEARVAFAQGDYVKALDTAIKASDAFAEFRLGLEEVQEARLRAQALRQAAREVGAEAAKLDGMIREGDAALEEGNLPGARASYAASLEWGIGLLRAHLKELLDQAQQAADLCKDLGIDPTSILNRLSEARTLIEAENFLSAFQKIKEGRDAAQTALGAKVGKALQEAADTIAHAKKLGADAQGAEELLRQANDMAAQGEYRSALEMAGRALEQVESVKAVEKRFVDLTFKAETTIRNGKKFGIDMRAAEKRLAEALERQRSDFPGAIKAAEDSYRLAWEAVEAFAPSIRGSLTVGPARLNEWTDATLELENVGKGLAKDVRVRILGDAETEGLTELPAVRAHGKEVLKFRIKMTASGSIPLAIQVVSHRVFDDKEYVHEMIAQVDVAEAAVEKPKRLLADLESRCPICKGMIKKGFKVLRCACGRDVHELCATRVGRCPVCFRSLTPSSE